MEIDFVLLGNIVLKKLKYFWFYMKIQKMINPLIFIRLSDYNFQHISIVILIHE